MIVDKRSSRPRLTDRSVPDVSHHILLTATPLIYCSELDLWIKDERAQPTGSFKVRGALAWVDARPTGSCIVTASSGNHAKALAWAMATRGDRRPLTVVVTTRADAFKVAALRTAGCEIVEVDGDNDLRDDEARRLAEERGGSYCSSHDDPWVIEGQSTLVEEIFECQPDCSTILVPVGGGGLFAGSVLAAGRHPGNATVIGVEPSGAAAMAASLELGKLTRIPEAVTKCDGLRAVAPGRRCLEIVQRACARVITVDDEAVLEVHRLLTDCIGPMEMSAAVAAAGAIEAGISGATVVVTGGRVG